MSEADFAQLKETTESALAKLNMDLVGFSTI